MVVAEDAERPLEIARHKVNERLGGLFFVMKSMMSVRDGDTNPSPESILCCISLNSMNGLCSFERVKADNDLMSWLSLCRCTLSSSRLGQTIRA